MKEICFVCSENTCRSPMAEKIFASILKQNKVKGYKVSSFGLGANEGAQMSLFAKRALNKLGYKQGAKKSKQLKLLMPKTLYITMEKSQRDYLNKKNVLAFCDLTGGGDIEDPHGENQEEYDTICRQIETACQILFDKIANKNS